MKRLLLSALLLAACSIGPQWDNHKPIDCKQAKSELDILDSAHDRIYGLIASGKVTKTSLVKPDTKAAMILGGDYPTADYVTVQDYVQALEIRRDNVNGACGIKS